MSLSAYLLLTVKQTLGSVNHNISAIPMPASAMKRSSSIANFAQPPHTGAHARSTSASRMSIMGRPSQPVFQRSSSGTDLASMGASTAQRPSASSTFGSTGRKSYAPTGSATPGAAVHMGESAQRRSSIYNNRPSSVMGAQQSTRQSFFATAPLPATLPQDPRRLKDASVRAKMADELSEYLSRNNFEMEMMHSLNQKSFTSPTQKDFNYMFQWLYHRIDPTYRFSGKIDADVPALLKQMRYPFEKSITKSQITAVGGNNWHTFLGLLHWMMQLARMMEAFSTGAYDEAIMDAGYDISGDRIIFDFLSDAYRAFLSADEEEDDDAAKLVAPFVSRMAERFNAANAHHLEDLKMLEAEYQALQDQIDELEKHGPKIAKLTKEIKVLEEDMVKFEDFNNKVQKKLDKYPKRFEILEDEIKKVEAELEEVEQDKAQLQETLDSQGLTITDIDRMATERERLQRSIEATLARLDEAKRKTAEKESETGKRLEELERAVDKYNSLGYQIGVIPPTAANAKGQNYELSLTLRSGPDFSGSQLGNSAQNVLESDRLLADPNSGYQPHQLLNLDLRGAVKTNITLLRKEVSERRNTALEQDLKHHDLLDEIREAIDDKQAEVEGLGHKVRAAEEEFDKTREVRALQWIQRWRKAC